MLLTIAGTTLFPKTADAQSPVFTAIPTDAICVNQSGKIEVAIQSSNLPCSVYLTKTGSTQVFPSWNFTSGPFPLYAYYSGLEAGEYTIEVTGTPPAISKVIVEDDALWPFSYVSSKSSRALGVDVKTNSYEDVITCGNFSGDMYIDPNQGSMLFSCIPAYFNIYLVTFNKCGNILWEQQIGSNYGSCFVKAMAINPTNQDVYLCGELINGTIDSPYFTSPQGLNLVNPWGGSPAYIARIWENNGDAIIKKEELKPAHFSKPELDVIPNPATSSLKINFTGNSETKADLAVYSIEGIRVMHQNSVESGQTLNVSSLPSGTYIISLRTSISVLQTRFVKIRP